MRKAFTVIELIFVIVIIGILASIAMVKMSATRDDAKIASTVSNIKIASKDIVSYAVSKDRFEDSILDMSDALKYMVNSHEATLENNNSVKIKMGNINDCITLKIEKGSTNSVLKIENGNAGGNSLCLSLQNKINTLNYPIIIKGELISN